MGRRLRRLGADAAGPTATETVTQPFRYYSGYQDPTGLYHYGARYYDPTTGRFTQTDPSGQDPGYVYAGDNPVVNADPDGEGWWRFSCYIS